jgi:hypothetical protein
VQNYLLPKESGYNFEMEEVNKFELRVYLCIDFLEGRVMKGW